MIITKIVNNITTNITPQKSFIKHLKADLSNPVETFINDKGERLIINCENNKLSKAKKYDKDGNLLYVKEYLYKDDGHFVGIFHPDSESKLQIHRFLRRTKETIEQYFGYESIDKYFRKFAHGWKRVDEEVKKEKVFMFDVKNMYLDGGHMINRFLRSGDFYNFKFRDRKIPKVNKEKISDKNFYNLIIKMISDQKDFNRQILDSIEQVDKMTYSSITTKPMVVYRDAPTSWLKTAKDGILTDRGFCSTSTVPGGSLEGMSSEEPVTRYSIELGENTPFWDLTNEGEMEMLLPRNAMFKVLGGSRLKLIGFFND